VFVIISGLCSYGVVACAVFYVVDRYQRQLTMLMHRGFF